MTQVVPINLGMVNAYLIKSKRTILVDTGLHGSAGRILRKMFSEGINPKDISLIVITHAHSDHTGSLKELKEATGAKVVVGKTDSDYLAHGMNFPVYSRKPLFKIVSWFLPRISVDGKVTPDIVIDSETDLGEYGFPGKIIPTPGHTQGSLSVVLDSGEAIVGDLLSGGFIRKKKIQYPHFIYSQRPLEESIKKIIDLNPKIIYTGHGGPFEIEEVREKFMKKSL
jgi:hydroxyacylglutathione hydrolase